MAAPGDEAAAAERDYTCCSGWDDSALGDRVEGLVVAGVSLVLYVLLFLQIASENTRRRRASRRARRNSSRAKAQLSGMDGRVPHVVRRALVLTNAMQSVRLVRLVSRGDVSEVVRSLAVDYVTVLILSLFLYLGFQVARAAFATKSLQPPRWATLVFQTTGGVTWLVMLAVTIVRAREDREWYQSIIFFWMVALELVWLCCMWALLWRMSQVFKEVDRILARSRSNKMQVAEGRARAVSEWNRYAGPARGGGGGAPPGRPRPPGGSLAGGRGRGGGGGVGDSPGNSGRGGHGRNRSFGDGDEMFLPSEVMNMVIEETLEEELSEDEELGAMGRAAAGAANNNNNNNNNNHGSDSDEAEAEGDPEALAAVAALEAEVRRGLEEDGESSGYESSDGGNSDAERGRRAGGFFPPRGGEVTPAVSVQRGGGGGDDDDGDEKSNADEVASQPGRQESASTTTAAAAAAAGPGHRRGASSTVEAPPASSSGSLSGVSARRSTPSRGGPAAAAAAGGPAARGLTYMERKRAGTYAGAPMHDRLAPRRVNSFVRQVGGGRADDDAQSVASSGSHASASSRASRRSVRSGGSGAGDDGAGGAGDGGDRLGRLRKFMTLASALGVVTLPLQAVSGLRLLEDRDLPFAPHRDEWSPVSAMFLVLQYLLIFVLMHFTWGPLTVCRRKAPADAAPAAADANGRRGALRARARDRTASNTSVTDPASDEVVIKRRLPVSNLPIVAMYYNHIDTKAAYVEPPTPGISIVESMHESDDDLDFDTLVSAVE